MLILTRSAGQTIFIGDDIEVTVLGTNRGQTRIGINAPKDVNIVRDEISDKLPTHTVKVRYATIN